MIFTHRHNNLLDLDSYKGGHFLQYPPEMSYMHSYMESRQGSLYPQSVFFGLSPFLQEYLCRGFDIGDVEEAADLFKLHGPSFPKEEFLQMLEDHNGAFPVLIRAVPEGTVVPESQAMMTIESTDPKYPWIVNYLETQLTRLWYPITVATQSYECKKMIKAFLDHTSDNPDAELPFKLHDFGSRGVSSRESAAIGGLSHLVSFRGTDTVQALVQARKYYGCEMAGFSIDAAEHSTITSWGKENEAAAYRNMLKVLGRLGGIIAVVSDSYDIWNAISHIWGEELKQEVIDSGVTVVIRPDSGEPTQVVMKCLRLLEEKFGCTVNSKGYKVLNHVRVIQGDGINRDTIYDILVELTAAGYSTTNIAFGMGGALLQKVDRDTQKMAIKCSYIKLGALGERDVFKSPVDDKGKVSKKGVLELVERNGKKITVRREEVNPETDKCLFVPYFRDGLLLYNENLETIRTRLDSQ